LLISFVYDLFSTLDSNGLLYANTDDLDGGDKLLLNYVSGHKNYICKTISTDPSKAAATSPVDWKFVAKGLDEWQEFETCYEIDTVFPLSRASNHFDTEKSVMRTIDVIAENLLRDSLLFFDGEPMEQEVTLDKFNKQNKTTAATKVKVTVYSQVVSRLQKLPNLTHYCFPSQPKQATSADGKLEALENSVHYTGIINSRVFGCSRNTIAEIGTFVRRDIIRSLTTRLQIYYDALLANDDGGNDEEQDQNVNSTIPPRRVFYPIGNNIQFGDYLFQNETEETTVKQTLDILDITISADDIVSKAEVVAQPLDAPNLDKSEKSVCNSSDEVLSTKDTGKLLLILGIVGALVALIIALILHFVLK